MAIVACFRIQLAWLGAGSTIVFRINLALYSLSLAMSVLKLSASS